MQASTLEPQWQLECFWWTWSGSNRRPLPCHGSALPAAPQAHESDRRDIQIVAHASALVNPAALRACRKTSMLKRLCAGRAQVWRGRGGAELDEIFQCWLGGIAAGHC